ncbi:O-acyltransferase like protein-like [Schistocerca gregaria]|uniref:O-acyltransferase like protein-like n=1 Tax=Schistocerca gregaria TaxID=7010 RepID=UPI00211E155B|nr:O-acyltransferase like protein-like [Schistocerca gregaria]
MASSAECFLTVCACLLFAAAAAQLSPDCALQVAAVRRAIRRLEPRAVAMADAWAKPAPGVLSGNTRLLGDFDECVAAGGRLCVADLVPRAGGGGGGAAQLLAAATAHRAALEATHRQVTFFMSRFSQWQWAACVPSACNASDARQMVLAALRPRLHPRLQLGVRMDEEDCSSGEALPWDLPAVAALSCVGVVLAVSAAASAALEIRRRRGKTAAAPGEGPPPAWESLSVQSGWRQLWALRAPAGSVSCLEALRLLSTLWVVTLHKMILDAQQPAANKTAATKYVEDIVVTPIMNGISSVDTFLMISGFLRCRNMLKELDEERFSYWRSLLQRLIRLVPAYLAVVGVYATLLERAGAGPLWRQTIGPQADWCRRHWHLNLLFLNNYVATEEICVAQSWYLSADMQLFAAAPLLVWPLRRWRRAGPALLAASLVLAVALPAATTLLLCDCPALIGLATRWCKKRLTASQQAWKLKWNGSRASWRRREIQDSPTPEAEVRARKQRSPKRRKKRRLNSSETLSSLLGSPEETNTMDLSDLEPQASDVADHMNSDSEKLSCRSDDASAQWPSTPSAVESKAAKEQQLSLINAAQENLEHHNDISCDDASLRYARYVYFPTHNRMAPYLVGIGLAYIMHKGYFTKITKTATLACWAASLGTLAAVVLGPRRMLLASFRLESALPEVVAYAGLHAAAWALATAWVVFACHTRRAGWIGTALEASVLRPWSRLCYSVYLTHLAVLLVQQGSMRVPPALDKAAFVRGLVGDLAASSLVSAALYLLLEAPCLGLGRALLRRLRRRPAAPRRASQSDTCVTAA